MNPDGRTQVYGILGYPVRHSLSPVFQNRAFRHFSINAVYVPFEVRPEDFETAFRALRALGIKGVNITLPHKEEALRLADFRDRHAEAIGSANTLKIEEDGTYAYNTDWTGFLKAVRKIFPELSGRRALVLGAGGSARAVVYALSSEGVGVYLWNRTRERAERLCKDFGCTPVEKPEMVLEGVELVVNTTSSGLKDDDPPLFDYSLIKAEHRIVDIIYRKTPLIRTAMEKGCLFQNGMDMLLYQGMESFRIWTGLEVPYEVVRSAVEERGL